MLRICLALLTGAYALPLFDRLPPAQWVLPLAAIACLLLLCRRATGPALLAAGFSVAWWAVSAVTTDRLPRPLDGQARLVEGRVVAFPLERDRTLRLLLRTSAGDVALPRLVRLTWYDPPAVPRIGETWRFHAVLRRPRGFANPGLFDYERWLLLGEVGATGYVVRSEGAPSRLDVAVAPIPLLRQSFVDRASGLLGENDATAVLLAIAVGARHRITREQWSRYATTGTSHLMAISGLHIGLAAAAAWFLGRSAAGICGRWNNARDSAAVAALLAAAGYALVSGFAVPAFRALLMLVPVVAAMRRRREPAVGRIVGFAALVVWLANPLSIYTPGFQLSFGAVAILLWSARCMHAGTSRRVTGNLPRACMRLPSLQLLLLCGLLPLTVMHFGRVAWLAPGVNLVVLPLFNLVTVPAALLGMALVGPLQPVGDLLLWFAWQSVRLALGLVRVAADLPGASIDVATASRLLLPAAILSAVAMLLPAGWPGRPLAALSLLFVVLDRPPATPAGCVDAGVLDVGQGHAAVLRTRERVLVYDTGPAFRSGADTGSLVVAPYLRSQGVRRVDRLVVSHADRDHAGGVEAVLDGFDVVVVSSGEPAELDLPLARRCVAGEAWNWDGVRFRFLHPDPGGWTGNDASCVLEVASGSRRLLLTGDIGRAVEQRLVDAAVLRPAEVVVVPHHGSNTSSSDAFVTALQPAVAIVPAGFGNRWQLPREDVVDRWRRYGATVLNTAFSGAVRFRLCPRSDSVEIFRHRNDARRIWHDGPGD